MSIDMEGLPIGQSFIARIAARTAAAKRDLTREGIGAGFAGDNRLLMRLSSGARFATDFVGDAASGWSWRLRSFLGLVLAPTLVFFLYSALWQTYSYEAEARITVRGAQEIKNSSADSASLINRITNAAGSTKSTIQDSYIVLNYIKSTSILNDIGGYAYLEKFYSHGDIDYFSRLSSNPKIEDLLKYWLKHVHVSVDTVSGILTLQVEAFTPQAASSLADNIIRQSESLINRISERSRRDAVARSEQEVGLAAEKLAGTRDKLTIFRDKNALIDPGMRAKSISELIAKLTLDKVEIESTLATLQGDLRADSPTQRIQRDRLAAIDKQISTLNKSLTSDDGDNAVSSQIAAYERLKLDEQFAELMYKISMSSYERARQELERQQMYLVVVTPPALPQQATYPKIVIGTLLLFVSLFILWSIGALIAASINDQII